MPSADLLGHGRRVMTVCNACRYCEQYCPVFPAMENRFTFSAGDLTYLANLCHNCGECLYACQYAPPHEFGINVPRTLAQVRSWSYEAYCWPRALGSAFRLHATRTTVAILAAAIVLVLVAVLPSRGFERSWQTAPGDGFYAVVPHETLIVLFGSVSAFVLLALGVALGRFWRDLRVSTRSPVTGRALARAARDALTLGHLHGHGASCVSAEETRTPWRRWFHHATFYGFVLCFASTTVAACYHNVYGWQAPYAYASVPVVLGTAGGVGLLVGPAGLLLLRRRRDPALGDPAHEGLDVPFIALLFLTSLTGLLLLMLRESVVMGVLLLVHLACVLTFFLTVPYGKFVHGLYRTLALVNHAAERLEYEHETVHQATGPSHPRTSAG